MERTNIRYLERLPEAVQLVVADVSFISLRLILPRLAVLAGPASDAVGLIQTQFEAGRGSVGKGGVVKDPLVHRDVAVRVLQAAHESGWEPLGFMESPIV